VDVNLDGKLDAVVAGSNNERIAILPGLGNGQFAAPIWDTFGFPGPITMLTAANLMGRRDRKSSSRIAGRLVFSRTTIRISSAPFPETVCYSAASFTHDD